MDVKDLINSELKKFLYWDKGPFFFEKGIMYKDLSFGKNKTEFKIKSKSNGYWLISRSQPFSESEKKFGESFFKVANQYDKLCITNEDFWMLQGNILTEYLITNYDFSNKELIAKIINNLEQWSSQTYEGNRISTVMIVNDAEKKSDIGISFDEIIGCDFSKVVSNGVDTALIFNWNGNLCNYLSLRDENQNSIKQVDDSTKIPIPFKRIGEYTKDKKKALAFVLNRNGEILIFHDNSLIISKRRGKWQLYNDEYLVEKLSYKGALTKELRFAIYASCLDVSFSRHGGCIGIIMNKNADSFLSQSEMLSPDDNFSIPIEAEICNKQQIKKKFVIQTINNNFLMVNRKIRQELIGIDGATVINGSGYLLSAGAILKIGSGSESGGRKAAARALSKYGMGIKISADGEILVFQDEKEKVTFG